LSLRLSEADSIIVTAQIWSTQLIDIQYIRWK
jgi:hypothetical protein